MSATDTAKSNTFPTLFPILLLPPISFFTHLDGSTGTFYYYSFLSDAAIVTTRYCSSLSSTVTVVEHSDDEIGSIIHEGGTFTIITNMADWSRSFATLNEAILAVMIDAGRTTAEEIATELAFRNDYFAAQRAA